MADKIRVIVQGQTVDVEPRPGWNIAAITTHARWQAGCGARPLDNWEVRTETGILLDPYAQAGPLKVLMVNLLAGIGV